MPSSSCLFVNTPHTRTEVNLFLLPCVLVYILQKILLFQFVTVNIFRDLRFSTADANLAARVCSFAILLLLIVGNDIYPYEVFLPLISNQSTTYSLQADVLAVWESNL